MEPVRVGVIGCGDMGGYLARMIRDPQPRRGRKASPPSSAASRLVRKAKRILSPRRCDRARLKQDAPRTSPPTIPGVELVAASDVATKLLSEFCTTFAIRAGYVNYQELLGRKDVGAVLICTPPHTHAEIAIAAARHGKHVFCEKPMAMTSEECAEMVEAAKKAGVVLQIGYVLRFSTERGAIRDRVIEGAIGRPVFWREIYNPRGGPRQRWVHDNRTGGGPILENSHTLDFLRYVFGEPEVVFAVGGHYKPEDTTATDTIGVLLDFPSGDKALFADSYALAGFGWDRTGCRPNQVQIDVLGPKGFIQYPDRHLSQVLTICRYCEGGAHDIEKRQWGSDWGADGYLIELSHFFECVREGKKTAVPGEEGLRTVRLAEAVFHSVQTGTCVDLRLAFRKDGPSGLSGLDFRV